MEGKMRAIKGKKAEEMYGMVEKPSGVIYPNVSIPLDALPEAKDWKVGKTYEITLRLKQTGMHMNKGTSGDRGAAQFDIVGVAPHGEAKSPVKKPIKKTTEKRYPRLSQPKGG